MMHHTVGGGPGALTDIVNNTKANFFVSCAGLVTVVSGGRANHAGDGAQEVSDETSRSVAPTGTAAARGLADRVKGNGHYYGFENENKGDGIQPWPEVQLDAMARSAAALCQRHCWNANRVVSHAEWITQDRSAWHQHERVPCEGYVALLRLIERNRICVARYAAAQNGERHSPTIQRSWIPTWSSSSKAANPAMKWP